MKESVDVERFAASFQSFLKAMESLAPEKPDKGPPVLSVRIADFLGAPAQSLSVARSSLLLRDLPNVQLATEQLFQTAGWNAELLGYTVEHDLDFGMATVLAPRHWDPVRQGPTVHRSIETRRGTLQCLERGLYLVESPEGRAVLLFHAHRSRYDAYFRLESASVTSQAAERLIARLEALAAEVDVLRGSVLSLSDNGEDVNFHSLAPVSPEELILPHPVLAAIERTTIGFAEQAWTLLRAGRHMKRGLLLHGPPGTGKSLTVRYLIGAMPGRTTIILAGRALGLIRPSCQLARSLAPATVVLEDVDLVAEDRTREPQCAPLLFELMNEMDGLPGDADIVFLLTTNRPDILEPALASRPGRIDQAIEFPLPDELGRKALFELYARGLEVGSDLLPEMVDRTEGASPAFIKELVRRAALNAAMRDPGREPLSLNPTDLLGALNELLVTGGSLTARLLGADRGLTA